MAQVISRHPANQYRDLRAKFFAIANKHSFEKAIYVFEKEQKSNLSPQEYAGLMCELVFAKEKQNEFGLTPTLDCGDHCDFAGVLGGKPARFDVTSSLVYKKLNDYEKYQTQGIPYYIVLVDLERKRIEDVIDINFQRCPDCGSRLVNIALLGEIEQTSQGTPYQTQKTMALCTGNFEHAFNMRDFGYYIPPISQIMDEARDHSGQSNDQDFTLISSIHGVSTALLFTKLTGEKIHACGDTFYKLLSRDGDGFYETRFYWRADIIDRLLPVEAGQNLLENC